MSSPACHRTLQLSPLRSGAAAQACRSLLCNTTHPYDISSKFFSPITFEEGGAVRDFEMEGKLLKEKKVKSYVPSIRRKDFLNLTLDLFSLYILLLHYQAVTGVAPKSLLTPDCGENTA